MIKKHLKDKIYIIVTHKDKLKELHYVFNNHMMKEILNNTINI